MSKARRWNFRVVIAAAVFVAMVVLLPLTAAIGISQFVESKTFLAWWPMTRSIAVALISFAATLGVGGAMSIGWHRLCTIFLSTEDLASIMQELDKFHED